MVMCQLPVGRGAISSMAGAGGNPGVAFAVWGNFGPFGLSGIHAGFDRPGCADQANGGNHVHPTQADRTGEMMGNGQKALRVRKKGPIMGQNGLEMPKNGVGLAKNMVGMLFACNAQAGKRVVPQPVGTPEVKVKNVTSDRKAQLSKTNRGTVKRMDSLHRNRRDLYDRVGTGSLKAVFFKTQIPAKLTRILLNGMS